MYPILEADMHASPGGVAAKTDRYSCGFVLELVRDDPFGEVLVFGEGRQHLQVLRALQPPRLPRDPGWRSLNGLRFESIERGRAGQREPHGAWLYR